MHPFTAKLGESWPPARWSDMTVLLGVSGGADSMALLRGLSVLATPPSQVVVGHVNHQLRGPESDADEAFVRDTCRDLGIACEVRRTRLELACGHGAEGLESLARQARYDALLEIAHGLGARYLATAHTADDQAETILHRILRGTGIAGLAGIPRTRLLDPACTVVRPLLGFRRTEVLAYLADIGQSYRTDSSNVDGRFTRNRLRHDLLPQLAEEYNPEVVDALLRLGSLAGEVRETVDRQVDSLYDQAVTEDERFVRVDLHALGGQTRYLVRELMIALWRRRGWPLQAMGYDQWESLSEMALAAGGAKRTFPGNVLVEARDGEMWFVG
jgi:tRNA(Ile)-lysidine synthase